MTVVELIKMLSYSHPDTEVKAWDPNTGEWEPITGSLLSTESRVIQLHTDDIS